MKKLFGVIVAGAVTMALAACNEEETPWEYDESAVKILSVEQIDIENPDSAHSLAPVSSGFTVDDVDYLGYYGDTIKLGIRIEDRHNYVYSTNINNIIVSDGINHKEYLGYEYYKCDDDDIADKCISVVVDTNDFLMDNDLVIESIEYETIEYGTYEMHKEEDITIEANYWAEDYYHDMQGIVDTLNEGTVYYIRNDIYDAEFIPASFGIENGHKFYEPGYDFVEFEYDDTETSLWFFTYNSNGDGGGGGPVPQLTVQLFSEEGYQHDYDGWIIRGFIGNTEFQGQQCYFSLKDNNTIQYTFMGVTQDVYTISVK